MTMLNMPVDAFTVESRRHLLLLMNITIMILPSSFRVLSKYGTLLLTCDVLLEAPVFKDNLNAVIVKF